MTKAATLPSISDAWSHFEKETLAKNTPRARRTELQYVFYSGIDALINMVKTADVTDKTGQLIGQLWEKECAECKDNYLAQETRSHK